MNKQDYSQNKSSLILKDITEKYPEIDQDFIYKVLLKHGISKEFQIGDIVKVKTPSAAMLGFKKGDLVKIINVNDWLFCYEIELLDNKILKGYGDKEHFYKKG